MGLKQKAKGGVSDFCFPPRTVYQGFEGQKTAYRKFSEVLPRRFLAAGL
jgi:hypothetical protein